MDLIQTVTQTNGKLDIRDFQNTIFFSTLSNNLLPPDMFPFIVDYVQ